MKKDGFGSGFERSLLHPSLFLPHFRSSLMHLSSLSLSSLLSAPSQCAKASVAGTSHPCDPQPLSLSLRSRKLPLGGDKQNAGPAAARTHMHVRYTTMSARSARSPSFFAPALLPGRMWEGRGRRASQAQCETERGRGTAPTPPECVARSRPLRKRRPGCGQSGDVFVARCNKPFTSSSSSPHSHSLLCFSRRSSLASSLCTRARPFPFSAP